MNIRFLKKIDYNTIRNIILLFYYYMMTDFNNIPNNKEKIMGKEENKKIVTEDVSSKLLSNVKITFDYAQQEYLRHKKGWRPLRAQVYLLKMVDVAQSDKDKETLQKIKEDLLNKFNESYQEYVRHISEWRKEQAWPFIQKILNTMIFVKSEKEQEELVNKVRSLWFKD